jgi:hypothetical protein
MYDGPIRGRKVTYKGYGVPFQTADPTIKDFKEKFDEVANECSIDGILVDSHKLPTRVQVRCINSDKSYSIVGIDVNMMIGCGCWAGVIIEIEEEQEFDKDGNLIP